MQEMMKFAIWVRNKGNPNLVEMSPNTEIYTYIASAINISVMIMEHRDGQKFLSDLALAFDNSHRQEHLKKLGGSRKTAERMVQWFVANLRDKFPIVCVDFEIKSVDILGFQNRTAWQGPLEEFFTAKQGGGIHLNGERVAAMVQAARENKEQRFRDFQFLFATTFLHEVGAHYLITWLGGGRVNTPPSLTYLSYNAIDPKMGESGRLLESWLFGGSTEYYYDPQQDRNQAGIPHQVDGQDRVWKIDPKCINDVCRFKFRFPFGRVGKVVDTRNMSTLGRNLDLQPREVHDIAFLGRPRVDMREMAAMKRYSVKRGDLMRVPCAPGKLLKAAA